MTATAAGDPRGVLLDDRRAAIEESGWGAPFVFRQPHNACWWVYLALVASGLWHTWRLLAGSVPAYGDAYTAALLGAAAFTAVFVLFLRWADRWERTPAGLAVAAFVFGGFAATYAIALPANAAMMSLYAKLFGQGWAEDWKAGLTAPFVEETAKGIGFLLLLGLAPVVIRTVADGLIVGAYVGLGFQVLEDVLYGGNAAAEHFGADQVGSVLSTYAARMVTGISSHALYTALFSAGLVYLIGTVAQPRRAGRGLLLILAAMVIHGVWDSAAALGGGTVVSLLILAATVVVSLVVLLVAIRWAGRRERGYLTAILRPEVGEGVLTEPELDAATGYRRQRRAAVRQRRPGTSRRAEKHVVRAARDLGHDLAAAGGETSGAVAHSRAEIARLRGAAASAAPPGP
ncbi:PrsW family intramembrane metalloprotease [Jiangella alba]|uniref:Membrane proteinase PrsW, cleaves anti-sigma factor RsiW, M82 family n=1 Tax=Jiangella alba TaxID=561176 RepID=A0A1H5KTC3_9ACTN|nr:PrsW family intramembrane metalloprotease [Jiangella alba]SEE67228.1 Membrane proteinase PrsW, cleaves anti-sigma factor RsiW, M82 family [Jiangella alba]